MSDSPASLLSTVTCLLGAVLLFLLASAIRIVPEHKRPCVFRLARCISENSLSLVFRFPVINKAIPIDTRNQVKEVHDQENPWGALGETQTRVHTVGSVEVSVKTWDAISETPIPSGARVPGKRVLLEFEGT